MIRIDWMKELHWNGNRLLSVTICTSFIHNAQRIDYPSIFLLNCRAVWHCKKIQQQQQQWNRVETYKIHSHLHWKRQERIQKRFNDMAIDVFVFNRHNWWISWTLSGAFHLRFRWIATSFSHSLSLFLPVIYSKHTLKHTHTSSYLCESERTKKW